MKSLSLLVLAGLSTAMLSAQTVRSWSVVETARYNDHRLTVIDASVKSADVAKSSNAIVIDPSQRFQEIVGFGGALTESSAWVLAQLPKEKRAEVLRRYYDPKEGIGYTLARTHINSCDFSLSMWALAPTPGDYDLHDFTLEPMRKWVLPLIHDAIKASGNNLRLMASPWSPPAWMKTNNRMDDGGSLRREYAPAWANYFVKFVQAMKAEEKISVWGLSVQNEPQAHQVWESCLYTPEQERDFVKNHLGSALTHAGLSDVKLMAHDHNRDILEKNADAVFGDAESAKYLWGAALHWYVSDDFAASSRVHEKFPDKKILFTEGCFEGGKNLGAWEHGEGYARHMIGDMKNWVSGYIDWNIALDERGGPNHVGNFCDAPVIVDTKTKTVRYQSGFYYIGHFSKFVKPGAYRIASHGGPKELESIAFQNPDGSLVLVALNPTDAAINFTLHVGNEFLACTVPAHAIHTYQGATR
ncbi:glycoside hydrolase family 30 protein [Oleiharenicola lentus]|uniref:glycoside hydrolase family 30 protein n=1 Tax=Oleiharenicola lentus TaxID=2508720 RepID=UPI003F66154F